MSSRRTPSNAQAKRSPSTTGNNRATANTNTNNNNKSSDYELLAKITKDPHYVARLRGVDAPPPPSSTSAFSAPFTRNDNMTVSGGAGGFSSRAGGGAPSSVGVSGAVASAGMARLWDNHFAQERIPHYDAVNDRFCKFNLKKKAEDPTNGGTSGGTSAGGSAPLRKTIGGRIGGGTGLGVGAFTSSAVGGPTSASREGIASAGSVGGGGHRLAPLSARTGAGGVGMSGGRLMPDAPTHQNYMLPNSSAYGSNNNNINNMTSATNSQQQRQLQMTSGATGGAATDDIDSLFQKSRYRLLALWEELGTPESDRAPLAPAMTLLPGQHPSIEAIRTITNEIQRLVDLRNAAVEVEKAIELREGFLYLLQELAERFSSQSGVGGSSAAERDKAYRELVALITPFRNASLQVVEAIGRWRNVYFFNSSGTNNVAAQLLAQNNPNGSVPPATVVASSSSTTPPPPPYMWKGVSYLHKMHSDTYFLIHSRLGNLLEYEVRGNPLLDPRKIRLSADGTTPALPPVKVKNAVGSGPGVGGGGAAAAAVPFARITKAEQMLAEEAQRQRLLRELGGDGGQRQIPLSPAEEAELIRRRTEGEDERAIRIIRDEMKWSAHYNNNNNTSNNNSSDKPASAAAAASAGAGIGGGASRKALPYGSNSASSRNNGAFSKMSPIEIQNAAATDIQRVFKGHLARRYAEARRGQVDSAIRIQRFVRRVLAKQEVVHRRMLVEAARKIQALQRGVSTRNRIARIRGAHASATLIQKVFRGYLTRKYTDMVRYLHLCATKIQATWRSYYVRQHVRGEIIYVRNQAATTIQAAWRGHYVRGIAKYNPLKVQRVVKLQAWFRGVLERRQVKEIMIRRYAATRIQAVYRMILSKRRCQAMRKALEDASWEVYLGVATTAAIRIQSSWRMFMARQRVRDVREEWAKKNQHEQSKALLEQQMQAQSENATKHKAAIRIQSLVRGHLARKQVEMLCFLIASTITMQRVVRGFLGRLRAKEQRAILVSYMEQKGSIPEEKSRILPSTSYVKEALSILEMEVTATAATTNNSSPHRTADHDTDDQDQTIGNVSAVAAPADEEETAGKRRPSTSSNATSPSKNGLETPVVESSGKLISSSAGNDRASLKNEEVQDTEKEDEADIKPDRGVNASSVHHVDHVATDAHPLSIEMTHHNTTNSAVEEEISSSPPAGGEIENVHENTLPKEEGRPAVREADRKNEVEDRNIPSISETPELEPFVVVELSVSPQDFAAGHFRRSMARRVFSLSKVKEILDTHPLVVSCSSISGSDSEKVTPTTTPTSSTLAAGTRQQQHASRSAFVSANAGGGGEDHPSLSSLSTVNPFSLVTAIPSGHSIDIFHVYQGSTHVCMRVKYFGSKKGDDTAEESNHHLDREEEKAAANQRRLDASFLACLLEDYAANRSVYKDLMAIVDLRRGRAEDLMRPAAEGVTIDDGVDLSLVHITSSTQGVSSSSSNSPVRRRIVASRRAEPIASLPSEAEKVVPEPKEEKAAATVLPIASSPSVTEKETSEGAAVTSQSQEEGTIVAEKKHESNATDDNDGSPDADEEEDSEDNASEKPSPRPPTPPMKKKSFVTAEADFTTAENDFMDMDPADSALTNTIIERVLADAKKESEAHAEELLAVASFKETPTTSAKIDDPQAAAEAARKIQRFFGTALGKKKATVALDKKRGEVESRKAHTVHFADTQEVDHAASVIAALLVRAAVLNKKDKKQRITGKLDLEAELEATAVSQEMNCASSMISRSLQVSAEYRKRLLQKGKRIAADAKAATKQEGEYEQMLLAQEAAEALSYAANANNDGQIQDEEKEGLPSFDVGVVPVGLEPGATTESNTHEAQTTVTAAVNSVSEISLPSLRSPPENDIEEKTPENDQPDAKIEYAETTSSSAMQHEHNQQPPSEAPVSQLATEAEATELAPCDSEPTSTLADAFDSFTSPRPPSALQEIAELKRLMSAERRASAALATVEEPTTEVEDHAMEEAIPEAAQAGTEAPTTVISAPQGVAREQPSSSPRPPSALEEIAELKRLMSAERRASAAITSVEEVGRVASHAEELTSETSEAKRDEGSLVAGEEASGAACDVSIRSPLGTARTAAAAATLVDDVINSIVDSHAVAAPLANEAEEKEGYPVTPSQSEPAEAAEETQPSSHSVVELSSSPDVPMESPVGVGVYVTASRPTSAIKALRSARGTAAASLDDHHHRGETSGARLLIEDLVGNMPSLTSSVATTSISPRPRLANARASEVPPTVPTSSRPSSSRKASEQSSRPNSANEDAQRSSRASRAATAAAALHQLEQQQQQRPPTLDEACRTVQAVLRYMHSSLIAAYWRDKVALAEYHTTRNFASTRIQQAFRCFKARQVVKERRAVQRLASEEKRLQAEVAAVESALAKLRAMEEDEWQLAIRSQFNAKAVAIYESELAETKSHDRLRAAALKIQCAWRCYNARFMFRWMRQQRLDKRREKAEHEAFIRGSEAALKIQCQARKRQARQRADRIRSERDAARKAKADHEALLFTSALKIQCFFRCYNARYTARFLREKKAQREALILQAKYEEEQKILDAIRDREAKIIRDELERKSAVCIQCAWRCYNARFQRRWRQEAADKERAMNRARAIADAEASVKKAVEQDRMDRNLDLASPTIFKPEIDSQPLL